jgi:site-specific recombinase XerD
MKSFTTFSILIWINASRAKNNQAELFARVTVNGKRINISLKCKTKVDTWNKSRSRVNGNSHKTKLLNRYLDQVHSKLFQCYQDLRAEDKLITSQAIKARFLGLDIQHHSLAELIDYHNNKLEYKLHKDTMRHYKTTQRYLTEFLKKELKTNDIFLKDLNYSFIVNFENFLRSYQPTDHQRKIGNNTAMKHLQRLRKMVTLAFHMEWIQRDPFVKFKSSFDKSEIEYLTTEELQSIINFKTSFNRLDLVKDLFVFSCFTGIAYIDIMQLGRENLIKGIDGDNWIFTKREKTGISVKVPILVKAQELIDKYKNNTRTEVSGTLFPVVSNQKLNSYLKEVADLCGIKKRLTFHMARHTFATTVTLTNGVPIETVSKLLGHTKIATTQIYARVIEQKVSDDMNALKALLANS